MEGKVILKLGNQYVASDKIRWFNPELTGDKDKAFVFESKEAVYKYLSAIIQTDATMEYI